MESDVLTELTRACAAEAKWNRPLLIAVDRDGTLVPITDRPEEAVLPTRVQHQLRRLSALPQITTAVVSARSISSLREDFGENYMILAGNYGMEIMFPDGRQDIQRKADEARPDLLRIRNTLARELPEDCNVLLEDHIYTLCVHWHLTPADKLGLVRDKVHEIAGAEKGIQLVRRPTSYEFFPPIEWTKAHALERISQELSEPFVPAYFGDSDADEAAFAWVNARQGISVKIGGGPTCARFRLPSPRFVIEFLDELLTTLASYEPVRSNTVSGAIIRKQS